jgi:hypothetical protein
MQRAALVRTSRIELFKAPTMAHDPQRRLSMNLRASAQGKMVSWAMSPEEVCEFFQQFQDYLAPKLDTYEQAIYLYVFRHSRFVGKDEAVIGFKSARARMAAGIGTDGTPMSEGSAYKKLSSLQAKGCIRIVQTEHKGSRIRLNLPKEIEGVVPSAQSSPVELDLETIDFFNDPEKRLAILKRENFRCFYTLRKLDQNSFVVDHVMSRPKWEQQLSKRSSCVPRGKQPQGCNGGG